MAEQAFVAALEERARRLLPEPVYRYFAQGARDGVTTAEATAAWERRRFLPHVLRDVREVSTATTLLGTPVTAPVAVAPTTLQRAAHRSGEIAMAQGVAAAGTLMVVSSNAGSHFGEIAATGVPWWLQAYITADRSASLPLLERAVEAGARAVVLTVDSPVVGTKYDGEGTTVWELTEPGWLHVNFPPGYGDLPGHDKAADLGPKDITWLSEVTGLPVVVKGVLRPDDARLCVAAGAQAVWVSNHGGRQLDHAAATADCVRPVAESVGKQAEVYVDGGLRSGLHVLAALALGARAAFMGRPPLYALAADGAAGVTQLLGALADQLRDAMVLAGAATPEQTQDLLPSG
jgi:4-hydroxymandelate oxidase